VHHLAPGRGTAAGDRLIRDRDIDGPIHLCVHEQPDFDCIAASYLARALVTAKAEGDALPEGWNVRAPLLARSARRIDAGQTRIEPPAAGARAPITPYLAILGLAELAQSRTARPQESWTRMLVEGHRILDLALEYALRDGRELDEVELRARLPESLGIEAVVDRRLRAFELDAGRLGLLSAPARPRSIEGIEAIELLDRHDLTVTHSARIAFITDPASGAGFFKNLIRGGFGDRIQATCVFTTCAAEPITGAPAWVRPIISVDPESRFSLRGLGRLLELRETEARRVAGSPRVGPPRPGYDNPDPWFDGRSFDYTIVDAPRWGTVLPPETIRAAVLDSPSWHLCCREDVVRRTPQVLRAPLLDREQRRKALRELTRAVVDLHRDSQSEAASEPLRKTAASELLTVIRLRDLEVLEEVPELLAIPALAVGLLDSCAPALRSWVLRRLGTSASWRDFDADLQAIDRRDLRLPVRLAAAGQLSAEEQEELIRALRHRRPTASAARLLDAVATFDRQTLPALVELGRELRDRASSSAPESQEPARSGDAEADALWSRCLREMALGTDGDPSPAEIERAIGELERRFQRWLDRSELERAARRLAALSDRDRLLAGCADDDAWSRLSDDEQTRRRERIEVLHRRTMMALTRSLLGRLAERYPHRGELPAGLAADLDQLFDQLTATCGIDVLVGELAEVAGFDLVAAAPTRGELLAHGARPHEREWLLWMATEEALLPGRGEPARRWARDGAEHELDHLLHQLSRAAARLRARPERGAPAYLVPALSLRMLPVVRSRCRAWRDVEGLGRVEELALDVALSPPENGPFFELGELVRSELRHRLPPSRLLADLDDALHRSEVLRCGRRLLAPFGAGTGDGPGAAPTSPVARFAVELIDWVLELPAGDCRSRLGDLVALRNRLPVESARRQASRQALAAADWAISALEEVRDGFEGDAGDAPVSAEELRAATRTFRARLRRPPAGGLALLVKVALEDVLSYLEHKLAVLERLETAEGNRQFGELDDLATDILECDTVDWLKDEWRAGRAGPTEELIALQRSLSAASPETRHDGAFAAALARARWQLARDRSSPPHWRRAGQDLGTFRSPCPQDIERVEDGAYQRVESAQHLDRRFADRVLGRVIEWLIGEYELARARRIIEQHRLKPLGAVMRCWLSSYVVALPAIFLGLFLAARSEAWVVGLALEATLLVTVTSFIPVAWRGLRAAWRGLRAARGAAGGTDRLKMLERLSFQLFLPHLLVAVLVGVVGIAFTDELDQRVAIHLDGARLLGLTVAIAGASYWALAQFARKLGRKPSSAKVWTALARLFTYSFIMMMMIHLLVCPLLGVDVPSDKLPLVVDTQPRTMERAVNLSADCDPDVSWAVRDEPVAGGDARRRLLLKITAPGAFGLVAFYPRHLLLYAGLGMFAGIFVDGLMGQRSRWKWLSNLS